MTLRITIDVFSGRPNPSIELTPDESRDALQRLRPAQGGGKSASQLPPVPTLGYRGVIVEQVSDPDPALPERFLVVNGDLFGPRMAARASDTLFEEFVCGSTGLGPRFGLDDDFLKVIQTEIERLRDLRQRLDPRIEELTARQWSIWWPCRWWWPCWWWWCWRRCRCAPLYEPQWWNDGGQRQLNNNCYNYATNYRTDTFAQPGQASGSMYTSLAHCDVPAPGVSARMGAISDDLIDAPAANNNCPAEGHLTALVIWPGRDFHWYRKGRNGYWSHKPGRTQATNLDNSGNAIADPRTADRGPYTEFCTFMNVMHGHIKIR